MFTFLHSKQPQEINNSCYTWAIYTYVYMKISEQSTQKSLWAVRWDPKATELENYLKKKENMNGLSPIDRFGHGGSEIGQAGSDRGKEASALLCIFWGHRRLVEAERDRDRDRGRREIFGILESWIYMFYYFFV